MKTKKIEKPIYDISIIVPVYHEQNTIQKLLTHLNQIRAHHNIEIIVVDGSPDKDTTSTIKEQNNITTLHAPLGRGSQLNAGARIAQGTILIFLHADTRLPPDAFHDIITTMQDNRIVTGCFNLKIDSPQLRYHLLAYIISLRSKITRMPYGDQTYFMKKNYFLSIHGFPNIPIMEDLILMKNIKKMGGRICILPSSVITSPRRWMEKGILRCTLENWLLRLRFYLGTKPDILAQKYYCNNQKR